MKKNLFLTGAPSSGKTTVIKKLIEKLDYPARGFFTEEERSDGRRTGFLMKTLDGGSGYLAHQDISSEYRIRRYGISMNNIEKTAVPSIIPGGEEVIILDEIGKMECYSDLFKEAAVKALDSDNIVIGTITLGGDEFIKNLKRREDIDIITVTEENRNGLPDLILEKVNKILGPAS
jgi:nucleoside-triphosphatase THEP1